MTKFLDTKIEDILTALLSGGLTSDMMSSDEKKHLIERMAALGMLKITVYRRFFYRGFDEWEMYGIDMLKQMFLLEAVPVADEDLKEMTDIEREAYSEAYRNVHSGDRGYLAVLALAETNGLTGDGEFYQFLKNHSAAVEFRHWMKAKGMSSITVGRRFKEEDWQPWERIGIKRIITDFYNEEHDRNENDKLNENENENKNDDQNGNVDGADGEETSGQTA